MVIEIHREHIRLPEWFCNKTA